MEARIATRADGLSPEQATRRTSFVIEADDAAALLVTTRFATPTRVEVTAPRRLTQAERTAVQEAVGYWSPQVAELLLGDEVLAMPDPLPVRWVPLVELTVGQLSVDETKVSAHRWVSRPEDVVLCACAIDDELMIVDGNSRAVAAYLNRLDRLGVVVEEPGPLQYATRAWCRAEGLRTVADLAERRMVSPAEHERLWISRCSAWLAEHGS